MMSGTRAGARGRSQSAGATAHGGLLVIAACLLRCAISPRLTSSWAATSGR